MVRILGGVSLGARVFWEERTTHASAVEYEVGVAIKQARILARSIIE